MTPSSSPFSKEELEKIYAQVIKNKFYDVLNLKPTASTEEITNAFHEQAVHFHPDQYDSESDEATLELTKKIYTKIVDAYKTLSNDNKRRLYDDGLHGREALENNTTNIAPKRNPSPGDRFFQLAKQAFNSHDFRAAKMNIQIALSSDSQNPLFLQLEKRIQAGLSRKNL